MSLRATIIESETQCPTIVKSCASLLAEEQKLVSLHEDIPNHFNFTSTRDDSRYECITLYSSHVCI